MFLHQDRSESFDLVIRVFTVIFIRIVIGRGLSNSFLLLLYFFLLSRFLTIRFFWLILLGYQFLFSLFLDQFSLFDELSTLSDHALLLWLIIIVARSSLHLSQDVMAFFNSSKYDVFTIKMGCLFVSNEKLTSVRVFACICHREQKRFSMLKLEVLVFESVAVNRFSSSAVHVCEITSLGHEASDDTMENASREMEWPSGLASSFLSSAETSEILSSERSDVLK